MGSDRRSIGSSGWSVRPDAQSRPEQLRRAPAGRVLLVEDGESRIALAAARALEAAGWTVGVGSPCRSHATTSRSTSAWHYIPSPRVAPDRFLAAVQATVAHGGYEVVYGVGDAELLALSAIRQHIGAVFPYADHHVVRRVLDKHYLMKTATAAGLRTPRTALPTPDVVAALSGPALIKNRLNGEPGTGPSKIEVALVRGAADAAARIEQVRALGGQPLLQEVVSGGLMALILLRTASGQIVAVVQQRADRIWPPAAGISARAMTVPVDPDLERSAARLLESLDWVGLAQLQFVQAAGEAPSLIDLNGRFYGSLALAVAAGVNLPDLWTKLALGMPVPARTEAHSGVRYQWLEGDLRRAFVERRGGFVSDVLNSLRYALTAQHSLWQLRDPAPAVRQATRLAGRGTRALVRRTFV
jgi:predicted ATP-grasp superfamily ATP-dependent carboligase